MQRSPALAVVALLLAAAAPASAQNLVVTNARVIDGTGRVIERGHVIVRDGKVASVAAGAPAQVPGARVIDARGRTAMPGLIDAHRHPIPNNVKEWMTKGAKEDMQALLDAGFTTVLVAITSPDGLQVKKQIDSGSMAGPRLFAGAFLPVNRPAPPPRGGGAGAGAGAGAGRGGDPARTDNSRPPNRPTEPAGAIPAADTIAAVEAAAKAGFDFLKVVVTVTPKGPEIDTLKLMISEGKKRNLPTIAHAVSVIDTLAVVEAGPAVLVHTPHIGRLDEDPAAVQKIAKAGIPMTSTLAVFVPHFGPDNTPLFRDALPFPWNTLSSAGQGPVNARLLWEAGISLGYGTDTSWPPRDSLRDEIRALSVAFSPRDIVTMITRNAARSTLKQDQIGTLETGKLGDIVIIDGNPLEDAYDLLKVVTTVKGGVVVFEKK
jgi:imidazolonepropionase-like amidohydrolase